MIYPEGRGGGETEPNKGSRIGAHGLKVVHNALIKLIRIPKLIQVVLVVLCLQSDCVRGAKDSETINQKIEQFRQSISENTELNGNKKTAVLDRLKTFQESLRTRGSDDLGSVAGAKHYKTELSLLAAYFEAGIPMDSGFGKWLKGDLDLQVGEALSKLWKQTDLTDEQMKNRRKVLDQLAFDLANLGASMTPEKMMEHTKWLEDNYEGFKRRGHRFRMFNLWRWAHHDTD